MLTLNTLKLKFSTSNWYNHRLIKTDIKCSKNLQGRWQHKVPLLLRYSPIAGDHFQAISDTPIRPEKSYHLLTGENKLFCNRRSGLNDLLLRASVSRLQKFVPWISHCWNTDLNSSQAFKRATLNSSLKPFRKASNGDSSHFSAFSPEMCTHTHNYSVVAFYKQRFASCFPRQGSQCLVFEASADVGVVRRQPPAILKKEQPSGPHLLPLANNINESTLHITKIKGGKKHWRFFLLSKSSRT